MKLRRTLHRSVVLTCWLLAALQVKGNSLDRQQAKRYVVSGSLLPRPSHVSKDEKKGHGVSARAASVANEAIDAAVDHGTQEPNSQSNVVKEEPKKSSLWSRFDEIDQRIISTTLPLSVLFAILPISGAWDLFWVNRLGDTLAVAGQAAANQVFMSSFWLFGFLPSVTATLVSQKHATGDLEQTQEAVCQAVLFALLISVPATILMALNPSKVLSSVLKDGSPALAGAVPYMRLRALSFVPMMVSMVGLSTLRGTMDVHTSVQIAVKTSAMTALFSPILIHGMGIGVKGAAAAYLIGDFTSAAVYFKLLIRRKLLPLAKLLRLPAWSSVAPLVKGSIAHQIRSLAMNMTQLWVARVIQSLDGAGIAPAAHALAFQVVQLGGILLGALGLAAQTLIANALSAPKNASDPKPSPQARAMLNRLLGRGAILGVMISLVGLLLLPSILSSSPLMEVREAARTPALIALALQVINGVVNVGEGAMMGSGDFVWLAVSSVFAALCHAFALQAMPSKFGLAGVWACLAMFTFLRLLGVGVYVVQKMALYG